MKLFLSIFLLKFIALNAYTLEEFKKMYLDGFKKSSEWTPPVDNSNYASNSRKCSYFGIYDFIIIGAGTAGAVVANRLSANGTYTVLLLEAGGEETELNRIPGNYFQTIFSDANWGYMTEPQKDVCLSSETKRCLYSRGRTMGGSSSINGMIHARGSKSDFDTWASIGNYGWSYKEVLPYFIKSENASSFIGDIGYHGYNGPFHIKESIHGDYQDIILKAHNELNLKTIDYNGMNYIGVSKGQVAVKEGHRMSSNRAYLEPIRQKRKNLKIITHALATKIIFKNKKAIKVQFLHNKNCFIVKVSKEVIVSAGAINTPQLLLLSGIGPQKELRKFNIPITKNLPVGKFMEDHPTIETDIIFNTNVTINYNSFNDLMNETIRGEGRLIDGPLFGISYLGFKNTSCTPNFENYFLIMDYSTMRDDDENKPTSKLMELLIVPNLYQAKSRGSITLKSADPLDFPKIDPNYFSNVEDLDNMYKIIKNIINLLDTETFKSINTTLSNQTTNVSECKKLDEENIYDETYWKCFIRYKGGVGLHASGTCRMGNNVLNSVVNSKLKIHGINNVRVVDASVFPTLPVGHPVATVLMLAEKASDIIINDNKDVKNIFTYI